MSHQFRLLSLAGRPSIVLIVAIAGEIPLAHSCSFRVTVAVASHACPIVLL